MDQTTTNQSIISALTELGLGQNEAILYEILLKNPDATIPLLTKASQFTRTMLYYILGNLANLELANTKKVGKKTVYNAAPPEKLEEFLADQEKELTRQKNTLKQVMGDLGSVYRMAHNKPGMKFFEGDKGIEEVTFDSLKAQKEILTFFDVDASQQYIAEMNKKYVKERLRLNIAKRMIVPDTPTARGRYKNYSPLVEVRFMPKNITPFKTIVQIYNQTVSFTTLNAQKKIGVIIDDEQISELHRTLFEYIWSTLPAFNSTPQPPTVPPPAIGPLV